MLDATRLTDPAAAARALSDHVLAARIDADEAYPWDTVAVLRAAGLMGMTIPEALGGRGASLASAVAAVAAVARVCAVSARILVESDMGALGAIMAYGTAAQRARVAAHVLAGDKPAICITEPGAGCDATAMSTTATPGCWTASSTGSLAAASRRST